MYYCAEVALGLLNKRKNELLAVQEAADKKNGPPCQT